MPRNEAHPPPHPRNEPAASGSAQAWRCGSSLSHGLSRGLSLGTARYCEQIKMLVFPRMLLETLREPPLITFKTLSLSLNKTLIRKSLLGASGTPPSPIHPCWAGPQTRLCLRGTGTSLTSGWSIRRLSQAPWNFRGSGFQGGHADGWLESPTSPVSGGTLPRTCQGLTS